MFRDIRLHGYANDKIEYYAIAAGTEAYNRYFFNTDLADSDHIRFFSPGNEFIIGRDGISHLGNGGSFCEYMFGVDQPIADLAKEEVSNRLVVYGTHYDKREGALRFSDRTDGTLSFDKIFFDGNAVCNYFFAITASDFSGALRDQQEHLVKILGKTLKRSDAVGMEDENGIIGQILSILDDPSAHLFLFKLVHTKHREYSEAFRALYFRNKKITETEFHTLAELAERHGIDRYQQERIRIDVMYKHPDNRRIVDEYKNILISCNRKGEINKLENARLTRLKTLSVRNKIPGALFYTLDEMLKKDKKLEHQEESGYISETREILEGMFLTEHQIESVINAEDMVKLLLAKKQAAENRDHAFEEMLLDASKACDEKIRDGADISLLEGYSYIITYFDRYDATSSAISRLAFMENIKISEEMIRSLLGNKSAFDLLAPGLFTRLFISGILENKYLGIYGRKKVTHLIEGLKLIEENRLTIRELLEQLLKIDGDERLHIILLEHVKDRIRNFYSRYSSKADQEALKREVAEDLKHKNLLDGEIPEHLFQETILAIKKEAVYIHNLLPRVIAEKDCSLREDFLENSGLDRFYIEELEREFFELNGLDMEDLYQIRKGLN
ncbi:TIGR04442 family protein [Geomonas sp. RF6]|uniref:TIGR04442 family protein n=1 Tax=Geomonas sp. RF6 TaxID=2897342 RepID=UPI001E5E4A7C|nr:TIGR04442 family protein [Geomonas sp. RF6]UFS72606.1 TIGR04442 family protein [Geomonas sp. RF6]